MKQPQRINKKYNLREVSPQRCLGFGASPQDKRREGYPNGQANLALGGSIQRSNGRLIAIDAALRAGSLRANDAASRPDKQTPGAPFFYPARKNLQSNQYLKGLYIV
jgi:hypothetical protein